MKNKQPTESDAIVLSQLCKLIPQHLVAKIARKTLHPTAGNVLL
jgi:hypothetical protein